MSDALYDEVFNDPLRRGYAAMTDEQIAESLNVHDRPVQGILAADFVTMANDGTLAKIELIRNSGLAGQVEEAIASMVARKPIENAQSRGQELGLGEVRVGHVQEARNG
jgi:uncharacterized protein YaaW (UPF0174 family)